MAKTKNNLNRLNKQVVQLFGQGNFKQAIIVAERAVKLAQKMHITEHPAYADSINNLAELYRLQARYLEAKPLYTEALTLRKSLLGEEHPDIAQSLNNLAALYFLQGDYSQAEQTYLEALTMWKHLLGEEHPDVATSLNNLAEVYREQGRYVEAEQMHVEVLAMRKSLLGEEHPDVAQTLNNLAALYDSQGRYLEAEQMHLDALAMRKSLLGEEHPDVAASLNNLAALYDSQGRYSQAEQKYLETLAIWQRLLGEHPYVASTLNNLGEVYSFQGRYLEAEPMHLEALAMKKRLLGEEHPDLAASLNNLAELYHLQGRYSQAEQMHLNALEMRKRLLGEEHPDVAASLNNLALIYTSWGRYLEAEQKSLSALVMRKHLLGDKHPDVATSLNNLARLYRLQGRYSQAEQMHLEALTMWKRLVGEEHPDVATSLNNLAEVYRVQGRYVEAEQRYMEALAMRKRLLGDEHPAVAASLNNLAVLYDAQFNYIKAESLFLEALAIAKSLLGLEHPDVATSMNNLAVIYACQGRYLEAEQMQLEVLIIRKKLLGEEHPDIALSLNNLAELYFSSGRYLEAEQKYVEALEMRKRLLGEEHPDIARSLNNLATVLTATERPTNALSYRIRASFINDQMIGRMFAFSSESDRLAFLQKIRTNFDLFLSLVHKHLCDSCVAKQEALDLVLKRKTLTASALAAQNEALYSGRYPQLTEKFRKLSDLSAQLVHLTFSVPQTGDFSTYQENLAQLQAQHNNLQKELASQVPEIQLFEQPSDRRAVASALPPDSILVEFVRFDVFNFQAVPAKSEALWHPAHYLAFVLPVGQPDAVQMVDLGEAKPIDDLIRLWRSQASDNTEKTLAWGKAALTPKLQIKPYNPAAAIQLSQALFQPIRDVVRGYKHLILAPDGDLNLVPFQILPFDETGTLLLMDEYTISYVSVGREIRRTEVQPTYPPSVPLVIADPDFDLAGEQTNTREGKTDSTKDEFVNTLGSKSLSRAPGTRFLGESVAKKLKDARLYLDAQALETRLTTSQCPSIMLIATHGLFSPDSEPEQPILKRNLLSMERFSGAKVENPMMRSGLALAGANTWLAGATLPLEAGKGFVFAQDIAGLDLWANELTVLLAFLS